MIILGRNDNQVKVRGLRIELGEIESALNSINDIKSAYVTVSQVGNNELLTAYYVADKDISQDQFKEVLNQKLPLYMIPDMFIKLKELPLTPNGKIDLKALPEPVKKVEEVQYDNKEASFIEKEFAQIFEKVLGIDNVSINDNFFELGGSSLTVTRVLIEAVKKDYNIAYGDVFTHPTPKALAEIASVSNQNLTGIVNFKDYNYSAINSVLEQNTLDNFINGELQPLGNVILTGATGFLGIHVLHELLENTDVEIYCMIRGRDKLSAEKKITGNLLLLL